MHANKYLKTLILSTLLVGMIVLAINALVDPFLVTGSPRVSGLNDAKPAIGSRVRQAKAFQSRRAAWDTLIVGNSRVEMGLDPEHACFKQLGAQVYNAGIPGAGVAEQLLIALNIAYGREVGTVFLSVDYSDFLTSSESMSTIPRIEDFSIGRLPYKFNGTRNGGFARERLLDYARSLFSLDALIASAQTLLFQSASAPTRRDSGFNPANDFAAATRVEGPSAIFSQKLQALRARFAGKQWGLVYADGGPTDAFAALAAFAQIADARGIRVYLHTNPFHDTYWALLEDYDAAGEHQLWLEKMHKLAIQHDSIIGFWDFSASSDYTSEVVSEGRDEPALQWFWESSHYRPELGDLMLATMLADQCDTEVSFGSVVYRDSRLP